MCYVNDCTKTSIKKQWFEKITKLSFGVDIGTPSEGNTYN
jgi:hypothetical protein